MIPSFVIVGIETHSGGVTIIASDRLDSVSLARKYSAGDHLWTDLSVDMRDERTATGATFREAMMNLLGTWEPTAGPQLDRPQRRLGGP